MDWVPAQSLRGGDRLCQRIFRLGASAFFLGVEMLWPITVHWGSVTVHLSG